MINWDSRADMATVLNALSASSPKSSAWRPQDFTDFVSMMPGWVWDDLTDASKDLNQKGSTVCRFLRAMGLTHPSEPTFARLAGLMVVCTCGTQARDHTPEQMRDL